MSTPTILDERVALWAARLVAPTRRSDRAEVAKLRAEVAADLPAVDHAARTWARLGVDLPPTQVRVVGRIAWVRANLAALQGAFEPLAEKLRSSRVVASRVVGAQVGSLLGLLSTRVLGQYVLPLGASEGSGATGQLLVVGPNLLHLGEEFGPLAADLRRSVLLHEVTHRLQFEGVPWLADHLRGLLRRYLAGARLDGGALVEAVLTEDQAEVVRDAQGLMTLLEGHGNAAMFLGADGLVADPERIRGALQRRRDDVTTRVLTAVAGLEMKKRQYREGEAFVREVVDQAGVDGLNRAFARPANLPRQPEVADPAAWLARVGLQAGGARGRGD